MNRLILSLLLLCLPLGSYGQTTERIEIEPGTFATIKVDVPSTILALDSEPLGPERFFEHDAQTYLLTLGGSLTKVDLIAIGGAKEGERPPVKRFIVTLKGAPGPPGPTPDPKPTDEPLRIVIVEESADRTPEQAAIYFDKPLREYVTSKGHTLAVWDATQPATGENAALNQAILDRAKGKPLPYLQVIGKTSGNVYSEGAPPKDAASMLKFIQRWEASQ